MIDLAAIRASVDIVAHIRQAVRLTKRGKDWYGRCPFHNEKSASFSVIPNQRRFFCHGCGAKGDVIDFVRLAEGLSLRQAAARLGGIEADLHTQRHLNVRARELEAERKRECLAEARWQEFLDIWPLWPEWARWMVEGCT